MNFKNTKSQAETGGYVDPDGDVFSDLRDMAKRFAQSIGHDYEKSRSISFSSIFI